VVATAASADGEGDVADTSVGTGPDDPDATGTDESPAGPE
jgi:hypothetical protein